MIHNVRAFTARRRIQEMNLKYLDAPHFSFRRRSGEIADKTNRNRKSHSCLARLHGLVGE